jgi:hypothetical protein
MKTGKYICVSIVIVILVGLISSCRTHRDCKGEKRQLKQQWEVGCSTSLNLKPIYHQVNGLFYVLIFPLKDYFML